MSTGLLRVSVVAGGHRLDLAVPPALPVAELVPGLARRLGLVSYDGLRLCTVTGSVLDDAVGLAPQQVPDGAVLTLAPPPPPPLVHDDPAEVLDATATAGEPFRWLPATGAVLLLLLGATSVAVAGEARYAAVVGLVLLAGALGTARAAPVTAVVAATGSCAYAGVTDGLLADDLRPGAGAVWAAAGGGVLAVAAVAMAGLSSRRLWLLPTLVVGTTGTVVGAVLSVRAVPVVVLACVLLVLVVLLTAGLPWVAVGRISRPRGRVDLDRLADEARVARELLMGLTVGLSAVQVALTPVVARHGTTGVGLAGCAAAFALLRARHPSSPTDRLPGLVAGALGLLATAVVALGAHQAWRTVGSLVLAGAGGVLLAEPVLRARASGVLVRPALQALESACLIGLLPLLVVATGALRSLP